MDRLKIQLLGPFRITRESGEEVSLPTRKSAALIAVLAAEPGRKQSREAMADLLWGRSGEEQARASLRQCLSGIRKELGKAASCLKADATTLSLDPDLVGVDTEQIRRRLKGASEELPVEELIAGQFLEGFGLREDGFENWLSVARMRAHDSVTDFLHRRLLEVSEDGRLEEMQKTARLATAFDPYDEVAHRELLRFYSESGRLSDAIKHYEQIASKFRRDLDVELSEETEALFAAIKARSRSSGAQVHAAPEEPAQEDVNKDAGERRSGGGELRNCVVLYGRLETRGAGSAEALEADFETVQESLAALRDSAEELGGYLEHSSGREFQVYFGLRRAHTNDAARALYLAQLTSGSTKSSGAKATPPASQNPGVAFRAGLSAGRLLVRFDKGSQRAEAFGEPQETAERLREAAGPGEILIDEAIRRSLGQSAGISRCRQPELDCWRVDLGEALLGAPAPSGPLVGREGELQQAIAALESCVSSKRGTLLVITGFAGIGKTRLTHALRDAARQRGIRWFQGNVLDFGARKGEDAISTVVRELILEAAEGDVPEDPDDEALLGLARALVPADRLPSLYEVLGLPLPSSLAQMHESLPTETRRERKYETLDRLLRSAIGTGPSVICIEDVHWSDEDTDEALEQMSQLINDLPLTVVMTTRPEENRQANRWLSLTHDLRSVVIRLAPLHRDDAERLAESFANTSAEFRESCIARAEGNPLFLEQLLRNADALGKQGVPTSIQSVIQARIDALQSSARKTLQAAAILGQRIELDAVVHLLDGDEPELDALQDAYLIAPERESFLFTHALIQESVYQSLLRKDRLELHERAARWFDGRDAILHAEHADKAGLPIAAEAYLLAAREQLAAFRHTRALSLVAAGLEKAEQGRVRHRLMLLKAEVLHNIGEISASIETCRAVADDDPEAETLCDALLGLAGAMRVSDELEQAFEHLEEALQIAQEGNLTDRIPQIRYLRGAIFFPLGRVEDCLKEHKLAVAAARDSHAPFVEAQALGGLGDGYYACGQMLKARETYIECVKQAEQHGFFWISAANRTQIGSLNLYLLQFREGRDIARQAYEEAQSVGNNRAALNAQISSAELSLEIGDWDAALAHLGNAEELIARLSSMRFKARVMHYRARLLMANGEKDKALTLLEKAYEISEEIGAGYIGATICSSIALCVSDPQRRKKALEEAARLIEQGAVFYNIFEYHRDLIELAFMEERWTDAEKAADAMERAIVEDLPLVTSLAARGRLVSRVEMGRADKRDWQDLHSLAEKFRAAGAQPYLGRIEAALGKER